MNEVKYEMLETQNDEVYALIVDADVAGVNWSDMAAANIKRLIDDERRGCPKSGERWPADINMVANTKLEIAEARFEVTTLTRLKEEAKKRKEKQNQRGMVRAPRLRR